MKISLVLFSTGASVQCRGLAFQTHRRPVRPVSAGPLWAVRDQNV